jgi:Protein of unknown function DUF88.
MTQFAQGSAEPKLLYVAPSKRTYEIVSIVAYLIGVKEAMFEREFDHNVYGRLDGNQAAHIIRNLCKLRTTLMMKRNEISRDIEMQLLNLDRMPDKIALEDLTYLSEAGIPIVKANQRVNAYIADINRHICERITACRPLFPAWIEWDYIKDLFIMPHGSKETGIVTENKKYTANINYYPYHVYIHWKASDNGNILLNDSKFLPILYAINNAKFTDIDKVSDVSDYVRSGLYGFVSEHNSIAIIVDCENSDPFKLCAALRNVTKNCKEAYAHIKKIILYDDIHSSSAWSIVESITSIPVEHEMIERVSGRKSLVDMRMTAGACKEFYSNGINAFLLLSSDSDFWGLISGLPDAKYLVMVEREKCGKDHKEAMTASKIFYCFIDDFSSGNIQDIKESAMLNEIAPRIQLSITLNVNTLIEQAYVRTRIDMTDLEKKNFYEKYIKTMKLVIGTDGELGISIAQR